jgi:hypothetical protein
MADPLEGCRAKIERAKEHYRELSHEFDAFFELEPYGIASFENPASGEHLFFARVSRELPVRWGVIAGEIVHHLRSALDLLAWQLVLDNGGTPKTGGGGTMFPIVRSPEDFESFGRGKVQGASEAVVVSIGNIQPYTRGHEIEEDLLYILHQLDIRDKHQVLSPAVGVVRSGSVTYTDTSENAAVSQYAIGGSDLISPLEDGTIILRHPLSELTPELNVLQGQVTFDIAFEQGGPAEGKLLLPTPNLLISLVDQMITWFRPMLQQDFA